jgi:DNA replicative helicase MCM subunit Mcm2 (Cdc46/Mcm family)
MVRLAHARARADLRSEVTGADAEEVVELMKASMRDLFCDSVPFVHVPQSRGRGGCKAEAQRLLAALTQMKQTQGRSQWSVAELHGLGDDLGLHSVPMSDLITVLNESGDLLKRGPQLYNVA